MNLKNYAFVALAVVGLAACNKNDSNDPGQKSNGEDTKISLSLSIASSGTKTYAPGGDDYDDNATVDDIYMRTVDIFIYDNVSPFALTHKHLNANDDFETINGARRLKNGTELDAKTGEKLIYVGVNLPASYVTQIKATQGLTSLEGVFSTLQLYNGGLDVLNTNGMAMFSDVGVVAELAKNELGVVPTTNKISLTLTRLLAKVTVDGTPDFNNRMTAMQLIGNLMPVVGGSIDVGTLKYSLNQVNEKTYLKENKVFDWEINNAFFTKPYFTQPLNSIPKYVSENLAENDLIKLTYAVVEARFVPEVFEDGAAGSAYSPGANFYTITDPSNGSIKYYKDPVKAKADFASDKEFRVYKNGRCYYHVYLNPENDHKVVRNEYYQVKISNIRGIGKSSLQTIRQYDGNWYNPELIDPEENVPNTLYSINQPQPAATNANIQATVTIVPWTIVASEHEL